MIDLHTHLLPDWDDGARNWEDTVKMAKMAGKDGVEKIVLTPHVYRLGKYGDDFGVLKSRLKELEFVVDNLPVEVYMGAEVFVHHEMLEGIKKHQLTINGSDYVFIEFPPENVPSGVRDLFYRLMLEGFIPIISHPERNMFFGERPEFLYELVEMGSLAQVTTHSLAGRLGRRAKRTARLFLEHNLVHVIASDAHDPVKRPPLLSEGVKAAARIVGEAKAKAMVTEIPEAILNNDLIPDWGDPIGF
ncbi:MAG: hypothetical protein JRI84_08510 [Deltaproteobacteria bacterium]|nr:hypothetical protein [Deltaproteobacteria bacterium]